MSKQFMCSFCSTVFSGEESYIQHFKNEHASVDESFENDNHKILENLKTDFPACKIDMILDDDHWFAEVKFVIDDNGTLIEQYFRSKQDNDSYADTYSDLKNQVQWKIHKKNELLSKIELVGSFDKIVCDKFQYGYSDDEHSFDFSFVIKREKETRFTSFFPWSHDQTEDDFINDFKAYFLNSVEGAAAPYYENGYFQGYRIDGIPINEMLLKANTAKLFIIE